MEILVTGAGGFIGGHLITYLLNKYTDSYILAVDLKNIRKWFQLSHDKRVTNIGNVDLRDENYCQSLTKHIDWVFNLASDRGGIRYITENQVEAIDSVRINTNLLNRARKNGVGRYLFTSSVCVYSPEAQEDILNPALREDQVWGLGRPNESYGIEKLFSEEACNAYHAQYGLETRIVRFNTVYGTHESVGDKREKAPAALCRKAIQAKRENKNDIEIWGDGNQMRTFLYIDDCVKGLDLIINSDDPTPFNLGPSQLVTINELVDVVEHQVNTKFNRIYRLDMPRGSNVRRIDGRKFREKFGWEPQVKIQEGIPVLYNWIENLLS